ncbi:hypothetical protein [Mythimna sequax nucleopolyhedrovirus]|nr:hypothetical protein [Mythimna sequax nucleopolyhedrovirus]
MYRSVDTVARRTRLQQRRREQLLPPLASSSWSRIEAVPAVPACTPVEEKLSLSFNEEIRAVLQEAEDIFNETPLSTSETMQDNSSFSEEVQAVLKEANELLTDYGDYDNEPADEFNDATLQVMVADINKQYRKIMADTGLLRRSSRRALRFSSRHSDRPTHQMVTRARRALVFDNNRDVCVN